jgi:hypothetical protein
MRGWGETRESQRDRDMGSGNSPRLCLPREQALPNNQSGCCDRMTKYYDCKLNTRLTTITNTCDRASLQQLCRAFAPLETRKQQYTPRP